MKTTPKTLEWKVAESEHKMRLDVFLNTKNPEKFSRSSAKKWIEKKMVQVNEKIAEKGSFVVSENDIVIAKIPENSYIPENSESIEKHEKPKKSKNFLETQMASPEIPFSIVFENEEILVVNKPAKMCVHPDHAHPNGTLLDFVKSYLGNNLEGVGDDENRFGVVHRIDKNTSGLVIFAKTPAMHRYLCKMIADRKITKEYLALVFGRLPSEKGTIDSPLFRSTSDRKKMAVSLHSKARNAITHFEFLEEFSNPLTNLVRVEIETGRTHQIRVHFAALGLPLVLDESYGNEIFNKNFASHFPLERIFLHAQKLSFALPNGENLILEAPIPEDLHKTLEKMHGMQK